MIPQVIKNALSSNEYEGAEGYSATTLISPPQLVALERKYGKDDKGIKGKLKSFMGTACHNALEKYAEDSSVVELRVKGEVAGEKVSAQFDHYVDGVLSDHKFTSVYTYIKKDFQKYEEQLNINAYLAEDEIAITKGGDVVIIHVEKLQINMFFWDWSEAKAEVDKSYPQNEWVVIDIPLWSREEQEFFITERALKHASARELEDSDLPPCSDKDRWYDGTKYKCMKKGNKRSSKNCDSMEEAEEWIAKQKDPKLFEVDEVLGVNKFCLKYCRVSSKCSQFKKINGDGAKNERD